MTDQGICLSTDGLHFHHVTAVSSDCRIDPENVLVVVDEAHAIMNDPLEAPMTPGPGNREYRTPANVKATDRALGAYDAQLSAFFRRVGELATDLAVTYLEARTILLDRMHAEALQDDPIRDLGVSTHPFTKAAEMMNKAHAEALQDDLIRDLSNVPTPAGYLAYLAARARVGRDHSEAIQEQWYQAMDWLILVTRGRLKWRTDVMNQANRIGRRDLWEAIRDAIADDYWIAEIEDVRRREDADAELHDRVKARLVARLV